jgi:hypothetical protein
VVAQNSTTQARWSLEGRQWQKGADDIITMFFTFNTICNEMPFANHSPSFLSICFILWEQPVPCPMVLLPFMACSNFKLKSSLSGSTISHLDTCNSMEHALLFWLTLFSKWNKISVFWVFKSSNFQNRI